MASDTDLFDGFDGLDPEKALQHMGDPQTHKWEGKLLLMLQAVRMALRRKKVQAADIERLAPVVVMQLCDVLGGGVGYIPRGDVVKRLLRDARLYDDWCGTDSVRGLSPPELAKKYRLATQTAYDIIARQRALHRMSEPDLIGFQDETGESR